MTIIFEVLVALFLFFVIGPIVLRVVGFIIDCLPPSRAERAELARQAQLRIDERNREWIAHKAYKQREREAYAPGGEYFAYSSNERTMKYLNELTIIHSKIRAQYPDQKEADRVWREWLKRQEENKDRYNP